MFRHFVGTLTVLLVSSLLVFVEDVDAVGCGYNACSESRPNMINVHLVPHTHDDVGWLKTVDQYYYGSRNGIQRASVQNILDTVVQELLKDPARKFIYAEMAFFFKWYQEQSEKMKKDVKKLVNEGRLEFVGGGWSGNDEAAVHYQSVIDQYSLGLQKLNETFGQCGRPRVGWQIDPFGHSNEMASIYAQMDYDGEFFARIDWVEKTARMRNLDGEMIWKPSESLGESSDIFSSVLYNHYSAPPGFCFDTLCVDEPIIDSASYDNNVRERIDDFISYITFMSEKYRTTDLLVPMGDDFNYENALINFKNMDKLIKHTNLRQATGSNIHVFYSTPACYLNAVHKKSINWPVKTQDFFPYSTDWHTYWTGFYSSRPTLKRFERDGNHFLQVIKQITALAKVSEPALLQNVERLREMMAVMQHHDAVTGTMKQHVANDYSRLLFDAMQTAQKTAHVALQQLTNLTTGEFQSCLQLNISVCEATLMPQNDLIVTLYNPLARNLTQYVRFPVRNGTYIVKDENDRPVPTQLVPVPQELLAIDYRKNHTELELVFQANVEKLANYYVKAVTKPRDYQIDLSVLPDAVPARFHLYRYRKTPEGTDVEVPTEAPDNNQDIRPRELKQSEITLENSLIKLLFSKSGHLKRIEMNGISENVRQEFFYYEAAAGNNGEFRNRSSGLYIFRPNSTEIAVGSKVHTTVYDGRLVKEVHQRFNNWTSQVVRIYEGVNRVEFEWMVGPIPIEDGIGKDVISRFTTDMQTNGVFWTDSNGREMLRRELNKREYFQPNMSEAISGNYYPVTTRISLQSELKRFTILNDRAQGGSSIRNGSLELMVHRRLLRDDAFGAGEALNETAYNQGLIVRGKMYIMLSSAKQKPSYYERLAQKQIHLPFWKFFSNSSRYVSPSRIANFSYLPEEIELLTLENFGENQYLLRLENIMDKNESEPVNFNIRGIFDSLGGEEIRETTLDGNVALGKLKRFKFSPDGESVSKPEYIQEKHVPLFAKNKYPQIKFDITLDPMQIRTFLIKRKPSNMDLPVEITRRPISGRTYMKLIE